MNRLKVRSNWRQANYLEIYFNKLGERQRIQLKQERTEKDGFEQCFYLGDRINSRTGCEDKSRRGRTPTSLAQERQNCRGCMQRKHTGRGKMISSALENFDHGPSSGIYVLGFPIRGLQLEGQNLVLSFQCS